MVTPESLDALDFLVWLNSGYRAAELCGCHQSSISRRAQDAAAIFGVSLQRERGFWRLSGSTALLDLEREVHQLHRLLRGSQLRLELAPQLAGRFPRLADSAWIAVPAEMVQPERSLTLVESRVIDGWLSDHHPAALDGRDGLGTFELQDACLVVRRELVGHPVFSTLSLALQGLNGSSIEKRASGVAPAFRR